MKWQFNVQEGSKNHNLTAEIILTTYQIEEIRISGAGISLVLQNNRPLLEAIDLKVPLTWRIIQGEIKNQALLNLVKKQLESHLTNPAKINKQAGKKAVKA